MKRLRFNSNTIFSRFVRASLVIVGILSVFGVLTIFVLRLSYERILYENSVELLGITSAVIEREIEGFEKVPENR